MSDGVVIRDARATDLAQLTAIAFASKASWGYDDAFMASCRSELTVAPERLRSETLRVAEAGATIVGFHGVELAGSRADLNWLFVAPTAMGRGVGRALLTDAIAIVRAHGGRELTIDADPHAVGFYERAGARVVGAVPSSSIPGRDLPQLVVRLT